MAHSGLNYFTILSVAITGKRLDIPNRVRYVMVEDSIETLEYVKDNIASFVANVVDIHKQEVRLANAQRRGSTSSQPWQKSY